MRRPPLGQQSGSPMPSEMRFERAGDSNPALKKRSVSFGERIVRLANDEGLRKEFGRAAKEDIKRLSPESVFALWDRLFGELARS